MSYWELLRSGIAIINIGVATQIGDKMAQLDFLVDTGATRTTIPKHVLIKELLYTESYIKNNKILLPERERPLMANGERADVYKIGITRMNIGAYELQHDTVLTSDTIPNLSLLLGMDILSYFKFWYDFDAVDDYAKYGKLFFELRASRRRAFTKIGETFAHRFDDAEA